MSKVLEHIRHDKGVIVRWELHMRGNIFIVEQFRGYMKCSSCSSRICTHSKLAEQLEENFQANNQREKPGICFFCGCFAREVNGLAICVKCAS